MNDWNAIVPIESSYVKLKQVWPIPLDIEFNCKKGEIFVIVGPSGSGKTTILRSIAGLYVPAIGNINCHGNLYLLLYVPANMQYSAFPRIHIN